jgi:hypothetical protein
MAARRFLFRPRHDERIGRAAREAAFFCSVLIVLLALLAWGNAVDTAAQSKQAAVPAVACAPGAAEGVPR